MNSHTDSNYNLIKKQFPLLFDKLCLLNIVGNLYAGQTYINCYLNNRLKNFLSKTYPNQEILWYYQKVDHDGYDRYGPKSDLCDLYLLTKEKDTDKYHYLHYYYEDWYDGLVDYDLVNHANI